MPPPSTLPKASPCGRRIPALSGGLKTELIYRHTWTSRHDAELAIFAWIEGWYDPEPPSYNI